MRRRALHDIVNSLTFASDLINRLQDRRHQESCRIEYIQGRRVPRSCNGIDSWLGFRNERCGDFVPHGEAGRLNRERGTNKKLGRIDLVKRTENDEIPSGGDV
jgi:hypothetical protein